MLIINQLTKIYNRENTAPIIAVDGITLKINRGDFVCIIGRSGSGKSTLLNMIVGLLRPSSGEILIDNNDIWKMNDNQMAGLRNSKVGYIPQRMYLLSNLNILDNIRLPFFLAQRNGNGIAHAISLMEELGIRNLAKNYPSQLSGGEMRKAAITRALMNNPEILVADEPTGDLDDESIKDVIKLFSEMSYKGVTILMVTHENNLSGYCNRVCTMNSGKLIES